MNFLIVNQSVVDKCASFIALLTAVVKVDGTRMSRDSIYDKLLCQLWITRLLLWDLMTTSTYSILLTAIDRYVAVIWPMWYNNNVRTVSQKEAQLSQRDRVMFRVIKTSLRPSLKLAQEHSK